MTLSANYAATEMEGMPELYEFEYGGTYERYTSWPKDIQFQGQTFSSRPIQRGGIRADQEFSDATVTITAPVVSGFERYVQDEPIEPTNVIIYHALESDLTDFAVLFNGRVISVTFQNAQVVQAKCESRANILSLEWPRVTVQSYCNKTIYNDECGVDDSLYRVSGSVTAISGATYTVSGLNSFSNGYFTAGFVAYLTDNRLITNHVGNDIDLQLQFDSRVVVGTTVDVYPGCRNSPALCTTRFNNFDNFLGMPYVPSSNPVIWGVK